MLDAYDYSTDPKKPKVIYLESDFCDINLIEKVKNGFFKQIYHLAAKPRVEWTVQNPILSTEENFNKSIVLARAAATGSAKFIFSSTAAVYGTVYILPTLPHTVTSPNSPYGLAKLCVENYLKLFESLYGLEWIALRYFNVYGPGQPGDSPYSTAVSAWCHKALAGEPLRSDGDGEQTRDMVFVEDVARANVMAGKKRLKKGKSFNVGSGHRVSNNHILGAFAKRGYDDVTQGPERPGDVRHTLADIRNIYEDIGWEPKVSFEKGLQITLDYWGL